MLDKTLKWNEEGIIQGPEEEDTDFIKRAHYLMGFKQLVANSLQVTKEEEEKADGILRGAFNKTRAFYAIEPFFVPIFFSNEKLPFWHGGSSWIVRMEENAPLAAFIQLRKIYEKRKRAFLYDREEILVHELAHVGRMAFNGSRFEEILAWSSSKNPFRRLIGPLFLSIKETVLFAFLLITLFLIDMMSLVLGNESLFLKLQFLKIIPVIFLFYLGLRLFINQRIFSRCLASLQKRVGSKAKARALLYRLSDQEIVLFSKGSQERIDAYFKYGSQQSLRLKTLSTVYNLF